MVWDTSSTVTFCATKSMGGSRPRVRGLIYLYGHTPDKEGKFFIGTRVVFF